MGIPDHRLFTYRPVLITERSRLQLDLYLYILLPVLSPKPTLVLYHHRKGAAGSPRTWRANTYTIF